MLKQEAADIGLMSKVLGISDVMAQVMVNRGIRTRNTALEFLKPKPTAAECNMKDIQEGLDTVYNAVMSGKKIVVYGDYDADGVMSTVILFKALEGLGADVFYYIPQRSEEGYGLNKAAVQGMASMGAGLIIACDNGITAIAEAELCAELGMELIIIDHHSPAFEESSPSSSEETPRRDIIPRAAAVIDPKQKDCPYPFKHLCAAGLSYKFAKLLYDKMDSPLGDSDDEFKALASIATVCDIVDLCEENRVLVTEGLHIINNKSVNIGLDALLRAKGSLGRKIDTQTIGFILGPSINASGRLDHARYAVELFLSVSEDEASELANWLVKVNEERRRLTRDAFKTIDEELCQQPLGKVVVVYAPNVHESIAGIVAGRIKDKHYRPSIVITDANEGAKGSARSIEGYNIFEELYKRKELFTRFGGHPMAAGLSLPHTNIDTLRYRLNSEFHLSDEALSPRTYYDADITLEQVSFSLATELAMLEPFGKGNRPPVFRTNGALPQEIRPIHDKDTIIITFEVGRRRIKALCFGMIDKLIEQANTIYKPEDTKRLMRGFLPKGFLLDMLYELEINEYRGSLSVQMRLRDFVVKLSQANQGGKL